MTDGLARSRGEFSKESPRFVKGRRYDKESIEAVVDETFLVEIEPEELYYIRGGRGIRVGFRVVSRQQVVREFLLLSILLGAIFTMIVQSSSTLASSTYTQPLSGFVWGHQQVPVLVQQSPSYAHDAVAKAMQTWNLAGAWFASTFHPISNGYTFFEVQQSPSGTDYVSVVFNQTQTGNSWAIPTYNSWSYSNGVYWLHRVTLSIDLNAGGGQLDGDQLRSLAAAEFGFAVGLSNTNFDETDLLNYLSVNHGVAVPSSLNLYAASLLSAVTSSSNMPSNPISLPQDIPYETPTESEIQPTVSTTSQPSASQNSFSVTTASTEISQQSSLSQTNLLILVVIALLGIVAIGVAFRFRRSERPEFCSNCGARLTRNAKFCKSCGHSQSPNGDQTELWG
jgi:hypothetical protein